jgi:hypothetical protein
MWELRNALGVTLAGQIEDVPGSVIGSGMQRYETEECIMMSEQNIDLYPVLYKFACSPAKKAASKMHSTHQSLVNEDEEPEDAEMELKSRRWTLTSFLPFITTSSKAWDTRFGDTEETRTALEQAGGSMQLPKVEGGKTPT